MSEMELVEAVKAGNRESVREQVQAGAELGRQDKQGWTALNWAAGKGDLEMVELLLELGADPHATGRDLRTPAMIALAAGHAEVVKRLRQAEAQTNGGGSSQPERKYCAAFHLEELRGYPAWKEQPVKAGDNGAEPAGDEVVFLHQDYSVTKSIWPGEGVVFDDVTEQWKDYCRTRLKFAVPDDLDLISRPEEASPSAA
jgi:hypothetical protein